MNKKNSGAAWPENGDFFEWHWFFLLTKEPLITGEIFKKGTILVLPKII
jgi:hypothetical protein